MVEDAVFCIPVLIRSDPDQSVYNWFIFTYSGHGFETRCLHNIMDTEEKRAKVLQGVKDVTCKILGLENEDIKDDSNFRDDLGADSLDIVELVMEMENIFGISIPDSDADQILTIENAVEFIMKKS